MISAESNEPAPLYGLLLVGGRSKRMGSDKSALHYHGSVPHARYLAEILDSRCEKVFYSCRPDQGEDSLFTDRPRIHDAFPGWGPLGGILSALQSHPQAAFLVVACDLPFLKPVDLDLLLKMRDPSRAATAFDNQVRKHPEPLCAIYEPSFREAALQLARDGLLCPTKILQRINVRLITPESLDFLENANHPEDYVRARTLLSGKLQGAI